MEQLHHLLVSGGSKATSTAEIPFCLARGHTSTSPPAASEQPSHGSCGQSSEAMIKANIMSHPLYPSLLRAFVDCRKVGAPPEVVGRLSSLADELRWHSGDWHPAEQPADDPELNQFMETYCYMLTRYGQEIARPIQEAEEFFRGIEAQIDSLALDSNVATVRAGSFCCADDVSYEGNDSSEDEHAGLPENGGAAFGDKEVTTSHLLNKYSGYLSSLWTELSNKKKNRTGHLPRDARHKLLQWWHLHYRWPYPSETEKAALAESTGLDKKQITNWFINQRKRHWKPAPAAAMDAGFLHPRYGASSSSSAALRVEDGGPSAYPRGGP